MTGVQTCALPISIIQRRLETARVELAAQDEFRHVIVNDDVERAVAQLRNILLGVE